MLSGRVRRIGLSPTLRVSALAGELKRQGRDVVDFSAGQPDFPTPEPVKQAGIDAIASDRTRYTANAGTVELREAIAAITQRERGLRYGADQILVSSGAKASLFFACMALVDDGDEVIVPAPYWVTYPEQVRLAGGEPVVVPCAGSDGFRLDAGRLAEAVTPRTKLLLLNDPSNPSGASYDESGLRALAAVCERHGIWVVADEIYSRLLFDGRRFVSFAALDDAAYERTVVIDGMSKAWSMTGWRLGWAAGPREVIAGMSRLQSHVTSNASSVSQAASEEALSGGGEELARRVEAFQRRRDRIVERLNRLEGVRCNVPEGAFYVLPDWSERLAAMGGVADDVALAETLLEQAHVATVPGTAFGAPGHLRFSYAISGERIDEGFDRIERWLAAL